MIVRGVLVALQRVRAAGSRRCMLSIRSAKPSHIIVRSWPSEPLATPQPPLSGPTRFSAGTRDVGEEDLVEVQVLLHRTCRRTAGRPRPGSVGRDDQHADALVLGRVGVGAHEGQQEVGVVGARRPHLLAVDDEVVAVEHRAGAQRRQVGAGARLAHAERRGQLARSTGTAQRCFCSSVPNESSDAAMMLTPCGLKLW